MDDMNAFSCLIWLLAIGLVIFTIVSIATGH